MRHSADTIWLTRQVVIALMAGAVSIVPQVACGMPQGVEGASAAVNEATKTMTVTGTETNNVVGWQDFSIQQQETVHFTGAGKNYLNLVNGQGSSFIDGTLKSDGGNVFLVNPNGVIFGAGAKVDLGAGTFAASTQAIDTINRTTFTATGSCPLAAAGTTMDVVNLVDPTKGGSIKASHVEMVGRNIRFLSTDSVQTTGATVNLQSNTDGAVAANGNGYVHIGYEAAVGDSYSAADSSKSPVTLGWQVNGTLATKANAYMLVNNGTQLQNMQSKTDGNYMLGGDITLSENFTPISTFSGNFDGNFFTIYDLNIPMASGDAGLFAKIDGGTGVSRIENVLFAKDAMSPEASVRSMGGYAGTVAGQAQRALIQNVGVKAGGDVYGNGSEAMTGGLVGLADNSTIRSSYNERYSYGGGIAGKAINHTHIYDAYNRGQVKYGIVTNKDNTVTIERIYSTHAEKDAMWTGWGGYAVEASGTLAPKGENLNGYYYFSDNNQPNTGNPTGSTPNTVTGLPNTYKRYETFTKADGTKYSTFTITPWGSEHISEDGGTRTAWRMRSNGELPALTAFYRGIVAVKYAYTMKDHDTPADIGHQGKNWEKPNYHPQEVYNGENLAITNVAYSYGNTGDSDVVTANHGTVGDTGLKNVNLTQDGSNQAKSHVLFQSDQYDVAGGNFTIQKRKLSGSTSGTLDQVEKEYDGTSSAAATSGPVALFQAHGDVGVIEGDKAHVQVTGNVTGTFYRSKAEYDALGSDKTAAEVKEVGKNYYVTLNYNSLALTDDGSGVAQNYDFDVAASGSASSEHGIITPRNIKLSLTQKTNLDKTYDGTTNVVNNAYAPQTNITDNLAAQKTAISTISTDNVQVEYGGAAVAYDNQNASTTANDRKVNYTGMTLSGSDRKNYRLVDENGNVLFYDNDGANNGFDHVENNASHALVGTGTILRRTIKADGFVMQNGQGQQVTPSKEYDATSGYTLPAGHSIVQNASGGSGVIEADKPYIRFVPGTGAKFLDGSGAETSDATASGYATAATQVAFELTAKADGHEELLDNYTYDAAPTVGSASISAGTGAAKMAGRIEKKNVNATLKRATGIDKVYDGTDTVTLANNVNLPGLLADGTTFSSTAKYSDQHVAWANGQPAAKRITYTITLSGGKANNYTLNNTTGVTAALSAQGTITPKKLTAKFSDVTKVYDGTTKVTDATLALTTDQYNGNGGMIAGDTVTLTKTGASYASKHVKDNKGQPKTVTYTGLSLNNTDYQLVDDSGNATTTGKGNGTITQATMGAGDIVWNWTQAPITKVYDNDASVAGRDANGNAVGVGTYLRSLGVRFSSGSDAVVEDLATSNHSGAYASKNSQNQATQAVTFKVRYDGPTTATPDADADYVVDTAALTAGNYLENSTRIGIITPKTVTVTVADANPTKTYDGNATVVDGVGTPLTGESLVHMDGLIASDGTTNNTTAQYAKNGVADKHVAVDASGAVTQKDVTYTLQTAGGADPSNYQFRYGTTTIQHGEKITGKGTINKKALTVTFADVSKQYDGKAEVRGIQATDVVTPTFSGLVAGDGYDDTKIKGVYGQRNGASFIANANAGTKEVEYTGIADALGENTNNYAVQNLTTITHSGGITVQAIFGQGEIKKRAINAGDVKFVLKTGVDKEYDGSKDVIDPSKYIDGGAPYVEIEGAEKLTLGYTINSAEYAGKDVAYSGGTVTTQTVTYKVKLAGDSLNNFEVSGGAPDGFTKTTTGTIIPRKVVAVVAGPFHKVYDGNVNVPGSGDSVVTFARRPGDTGDALVGGDDE